MRHPDPRRGDQAKRTDGKRKLTHKRHSPDSRQIQIQSLGIVARIHRLSGQESAVYGYAISYV